MPKGKDERRQVLSYIDTALLISEKGGSFNLDDFLEDAPNPFDFLLSIIQKYVDKDEVLEWLVNMMTVTLPVIEIGVKGVLLAQLKGMVDCNLDPRIPRALRQFDSDTRVSGNFSYYGQSLNYRGIFVGIKDIDYKGILGTSPLSEKGQSYYYGAKSKYVIEGSEDDDAKTFSTYGDARKYAMDNKLYFDSIIDKSDVKNVYELSRADDFNAFLWFATHKARFTDASSNIDLKGNSALNLFTLSGNVEKGESIPYGVGTAIAKGKNVALCYRCDTALTEVNKTENGLEDYNPTEFLTSEAKNKIEAKEYNAHFYPVSSDVFSANWYANKATYYNFLLPKKKRKIRDKNKDYAICNVKYFDELDIDIGLPKNKEYIQLTVLPKPFVHGIVRILFNDKGEPDKNGNYTVQVTGGDVVKGEYTIQGGTLKVYSDLSYSIRLNDGATLADALIPCYRGQTVYEFNYDYVMSMKLFDPEVVAKQILDIALNLQPSYSLGPTVSKTETMYQMRISEIVKNIIEATAYETTDCFYTFDNAKYDKMSSDAELKRSQGYAFNDSHQQMTQVNADEVYKILNEFDNNATLEENKDVFTRAFTEATATITDEVLPEDKYSVELNLIINMIKGLATTIVETLLSPKLVLLFEVNRKLMGDQKNNLSIEDFLKSIEGLLVGVINEIRDMILQELLNWVLKIITKLIAKVKIELELEKYKNYAALMILLLKACWFEPKHRKNLDSQLDNVDYADIDPIEQPATQEC